MFSFSQNRLVFQKKPPRQDNLPPKKDIPPNPVAENPALKRAPEETEREEARTKRRGLEAATQAGALEEPPKVSEGEVDEIRRLAREQGEKMNLQLKTNAKVFYEALIAHRQIPPEVVTFNKELEENQRLLKELAQINPKTPEELEAFKDNLEKAQAKSLALKNKAPEIAKIIEMHERLLKEGKELRKLAESEKVSLSELQGGWKWLGLGEELDKDGNIVNKNLTLYENRFTKLAKAYLDITIDPETKQEIFVVKKELDTIPKIKYGLGAGHLLSPAIQTVAITDPRTKQTYYGRRMIVRDGRPVDTSQPGTTGKLGYYMLLSDGNFKYIPIYGGFIIRPIELVEKDGTYVPANPKEAGKAIPAFLPEDSPEYQEAVRKEATNYTTQASIIAQAEKYTEHTPANVLKYIGRTDYPVSGLKSLRLATSKILSPKLPHYSKEQREEEIARIMGAKQDLTRTEFLLDYHGIRLSADNDIDGALQLVGLSNIEGGAAGMLGWDPSHTELQEKWRAELLDKNFIEKNREGDKLTLEYQGKKITLKITIKDKAYHFSELDSGKEITDIGNWAIEKAAALLPKKENQTVNLIKAMQNGGSITANQKEFTFSSSEEYALNFSHLFLLNQLAKNSTELAKALEKLQKPIKPSEFIASLLLGAGKQGLTLEQAQKWVRDNHFSILFDEKSNVRLDNLMRQGAEEAPTKTLNPNWNVNQNKRALGNKCCAIYVSRILGLKNRSEGFEGLVSRLISRLIRGGREIVFGFENFIAGDVIAWTKHNKKLNKTTYAHVGIIRDTIEHAGTKWLVIQEESGHIKANFVPVKTTDISPLKNLIAHLKKTKNEEEEIDRLKNAGQINAHTAAVLKTTFQYRHAFKDTINVHPNHGWYGDGSKGAGGNIAFAVRTNIKSPTDTFERPSS
ncbi:hypothetical protein HY604_05295 [Candidatus Peregrinibacteria bacterium]|nr:hypothetical protein [Candidatus Peregrinibacteria bacterium]